MSKRIIATLTLISFIFYIYGCYTITPAEISDDNIKELKESEIISVISKDYEVYEFERGESQPKPQIMDSTLIGWIKTKLEDDSYTTKEVQVTLSNIKTIYYEENNTELVLGIIVGAAGIGLIVYFVSSIINDTKIEYPFDINIL